MNYQNGVETQETLTEKCSVMKKTMLKTKKVTLAPYQDSKSAYSRAMKAGTLGLGFGGPAPISRATVKSTPPPKAKVKAPAKGKPRY